MYDAERLKEWKERKLMRHEDEKLKELYLQEQSAKENTRMQEEAREIRETELNEKWKKFMLETEIDKHLVSRMHAESSISLSLITDCR